MTNNIMVKQWSFCEACKGRGCLQCRGKEGGDPRTGVTCKLVPLESIPKLVHYEYIKAQKGFIESQREKSTT